jgi:hypothetical protein
MLLWYLWLQAVADCMRGWPAPVTITLRQPAQVIDLNSERTKRRSALNR